MPRRYGSKVAVRDVCYEVLYQAEGRAMHVADMARAATSGGLFRLAGLDVDAASVSNTMATKMNNEIRRDGPQSRFQRVGENTFRLSDAARATYAGRYRELVEAAKADRRTASARAGEIRNTRTVVPPVATVRLAPLSETAACEKPSWPALSTRAQRLIQSIETHYADAGDFAGRLRATAALRQGDVAVARAFLMQLRQPAAAQ